VDPSTLLESAARRRRTDAILCGRARLDYAGLHDLTRRIGRQLQTLGARPGDRVAALFHNCHLFLATYFAALERRLVLVPINIRLAPREVRAILEHSGARLLLGDPGLAAPHLPEEATGGEGWVAGPTGAEEDGARQPAPEDAAHLYYTSGTTGRPKGVVLTRANLKAHVQMTTLELGFSERDVWLHAAPMFHLADAWAIWTATAAAAGHVLLARFDPAGAFDLIESEGVTITNLVPTMLIALVQEAERRGRGLPSLRLLLSGGAPIAPGVVARVRQRIGCRYAQTYGLTETSPFLTFSLLDDGLRRLAPDEQERLIARTGRKAAGVEMRIVRPVGSDTFEDVPADDASVGEVVVRGPTVTPGYWRDPEATREAFKGGWFHTGDLGTIDRHGFVLLVDRAKDVIVTGGESVYCIEVENVLHEHPGVREAAVFGVPDDHWGEAVRAAVVLDDSASETPDGLVAFCRERLGRYKCPRAIDLRPALPRTGSGKIDKKVLREPFWEGRARRIN
jgi:acyl-CoA synthetase (AMP-forming)/AMP-acid ligase II